MKVAVFYHLKFGGAKRVVMDQVKGFKEGKNVVDVFSINNSTDFFDPSIYANSFKNHHFSTRYLDLPFLGKFLYFYYVLYSLRNLQKNIAGEIDSRNYDIVIVHPDMYTQAPFVLRFLKTKSVYYSQEPYRIAYEHGMRIEESLPIYIRFFEDFKRYIIKVVDRKNVSSCNHVLTSSYSVRERMIQSYDVYAKVCPPGINTKVFKASGFKKKKHLLFVGSKTDRIDGYDLLIKALSYFPKSKRPKVRFVVWKKNNNERISEKELAKIYETSLATMCMSRFETFGLIPLESMACGTPVIATNIGGHRETVLNKTTGFLVEPDPKEIYEKIKLIQNYKGYSQLSNNCVKHVKRYWSLKVRNKQLIETIKSFL